LTDQGQVRANNEDSFYIDPGQHLFLVADGLGGHAGGEQASSTVVETVAEAADQFAGWEDPLPELLGLLETADAAVRAKAVGPLTNMGSTVVTLFLRDQHYWTAHAGDSRAYRFRDGQLEQLTRDHTPEQENGTPLASNYRSGMITRAVGIGSQTEFDVTDGSIQAGDTYLLCSDGLTDAIDDEDIISILNTYDDPPAAARNLVAAANAAGGPDNVTVVIVTVP
jgi:protein phosphatase